MIAEPVTAAKVEAILKQQQAFWASGRTRDVDYRLEQLRRLKAAIQRMEPQIMESMHQDLRKSETETYLTEILIVLRSIDYTLKHLRKWAKPKRVRTPLPLLPGSSEIRSEPYGTVLIIGPFNYPFQLVIEPLIGALSAGNCAILKPSESTPHVAALIEQLVTETFEPAYVSVVQGEKETTSALIHSPVDYIFFTGSTAVGKVVMEAAAQRLVPVTLELGGKSPVIVDETAKLDIAAKRIVWGKLINTGQTCIAPDYVLAHCSIREELVKRMRQAMVDFYGEQPQTSPDYGRIVNTRQFDRLAAILELDASRIVHGGARDREELYIAPTLLDGVSIDDAVMQEELFGPLLPVLTYDALEDAIAIIERHPKPLALYLFTERESRIAEIVDRVRFGGGCVNDTIMHVASHHLPFGGVGTSGIGAYHGRHSFELFSHRKSVLRKSSRFEPGFAFPPYGDKLDKLKKFLR
ncbi:aldehyde dehydrogenase [Paenibacillus sp. 598K]|uniref:aldehyde dehydrogenase n=1 Tax=Paenibacillus sp. 598K TaxID=1117987 RepID=UPI000FFA4D2E|nr:aldehyde dehydrogenase [Paenibacillus sp. 598K]GBF77065.1 aldehyde dehydrogenase [Paenibacillus sp. 598K]